jgi:tetratricopeptide (TPR) repeat protein
VPWRIDVLSSSAVPVIAHTEGQYALTPPDGIHPGPQPVYRYPPAAARQASDLADLGHDEELQGRRLAAMALYVDGVTRYPASVELNRAAGRLATALHWTESTGGSGSSRAIRWLTTAADRDPTDAETRYYLGLARAAADQPELARPHFEAAMHSPTMHGASLLQLARLASRAGDRAGAARLSAAALAADPHSTVARTLAIACARIDGAREQAHEYAGDPTADPTDNLLRYERVLLGAPNEALWPHLASDPNRILDLVDQYLALGAFADARDLLSREYPDTPALTREPGIPPPSQHVLIAYYRAYVEERLDRSAVGRYSAASALPTPYVFPSRASTYAVLERALHVNPADATARFLLGSLYLSGGLVDEAIGQWERARALRPSIPTLHRNLGLTLLTGRNDVAKAREVLAEGLTYDKGNVELYQALDQVLSLLRVPAAERAMALTRFPATSRPPALAFTLALALAEAGKFDEADAVFRNQFFPREEGGTSVRAVYAQVRLLRAADIARRGACAPALAAIEELARPAPDLSFTTGGLADVIQRPVSQLQIAGVEARCGQSTHARDRWLALERAGSATDASPFHTALGYAAARARTGADADSWRPRLVRALAGVDATIDASDDGAGSLHYVRALLLDALHRPAERDAALLAVLRLPDRNLSHHLARAALDAGRAGAKGRQGLAGAGGSRNQ